MPKGIEDVVALILNFNTAALTIRCIDNLLSLSDELKIVVVDNNSSDGSLEKLNRLYETDNRIHILQNKTNAGYAQGNNIGIKYIRDHFLKARYVLVHNPDVVTNSKEIIHELKKVLEEHEEYAIASCQVILNNQLRYGYCTWKYPDKKHMWCAGTFSQRLLFIAANTDYDELEIHNNIAEVDAVTGCFFLGKLDELKKVNDFDERTFLYFEEVILAKKLIRNNKREVILINECVYHNHQDKDKSLRDYRRKLFDRKCFLKSKMIYTEYYSEMTGAELALCKLFNNIDLKLKELIYGKILSLMFRHKENQHKRLSGS